MSNTKLRQKYDVIFAETLEEGFSATDILAEYNPTIPANTGDILAFASGNIHWNPIGAATTTSGHAVVAYEPFLIPRRYHNTVEIIGDAGAVVVTLVYMRGAGRQDTSYTAQARPF